MHLSPPSSSLAKARCQGGDAPCPLVALCSLSIGTVKGTLVDDGCWPEQEEWLPGAVEALRAMLQRGRVKISTLRLNPYEVGCDGDEDCRRSAEDIGTHLLSIREMLDDQGLHEVEIHTTKGKPAGTYYIDNQAIEFKGDWQAVLEQVLLDDPASIQTVGGVWPVRVFDTGATRDTDDDKLAYEGFFSPLVLEERAKYMHKHRVQSDGNLRAPDNWQKGMPLEAYIDSGWRHFMDWWLNHRGYTSRESVREALCGLMFNCEGYLHELLKDEA